MMSRSPAIQQFLDDFAVQADIQPDFVAASDHPYTCRCNICLAWWVKMVDAEDNEYSPFTQLEIETARAASEENDDETGTD